MTRTRWQSLLLAVLAALILLLAGRVVPTISHGPMPYDLRSFYFAAAGFGQGGNIYDSQYLSRLAAQAGAGAHVWPYLYPPPLAVYLSPVAQFGMKSFTRLWMLASLISGVLVILLSARLAFRILGTGHDPAGKGQTGWSRAGVVRQDDAPPCRFLSGLPGPALLALLLCLVLPFGNNLGMGQVNLVVLACITGALVLSLVQNRDTLAGVLLAPAILVKVTPIGLLLFFALNRRYRVLTGCAAALAVLIAPTLLIDGGLRTWGQFLRFDDYLTYGKTIPGLFAAASLPNFSLAGCLARISRSEAFTRWASLAIVVFLGLILTRRHWRARGKDSSAMLIGPYLILMVVASPLAYLHHVVYIYPGLLATMWMALMRGGRRALALSLSMLGLAVVAGIDFPVLYGRLGVTSPVLSSLNLYALLGLFALGLVAAKDSGRPGGARTA